MNKDRFAIWCAKDFYRCKKRLEAKGVSVDMISTNEIRFGDNYVKVGYAKKGKIISYYLSGVTSEIKLGVPAKGYGRWIYCKYCYKNVQPYFLHEELEALGKVVKQSMLGCPNCTAGLKVVRKWSTKVIPP